MADGGDDPSLEESKITVTSTTIYLMLRPFRARRFAALIFWLMDYHVEL